MRKKEYIDRPKIYAADLDCDLEGDQYPFDIDSEPEGNVFINTAKLGFRYDGNTKREIVDKKMTDYSYQTKNSRYWFMWLGRKNRIEFL